MSLGSLLGCWSSLLGIADGSSEGWSLGSLEGSELNVGTLEGTSSDGRDEGVTEGSMGCGMVPLGSDKKVTTRSSSTTRAHVVVAPYVVVCGIDREELCERIKLLQSSWVISY